MPERTAGAVDLVLARLARTCIAASAKRIIPEAPMGLDDSTPPDGFQGMSPSICVAPSSTRVQPLPSSAKPRFSSHMGSYHENGT